MEYLHEQLSLLATVYASNQNLEVIGVFLVAMVCLVGLYLLLRKPLSGELGMGNGEFKISSAQLSKRDKKLVVELLEDVIEERVLFKKLKRTKARDLYKKLGLLLDIPELVPPGEIKAIIKARRRYLNGHNKPVIIPGDLPIQNPQGVAKKQKFEAFFRPAR